MVLTIEYEVMGVRLSDKIRTVLVMNNGACWWA